MPDQLWGVSINEAIDMIEAHRRRREQEEKEEFQKQIALLDLFSTNLIEKVISVLGKGEGEGMRFSMLEYFPELFPSASGSVQQDTDGCEPGLSKEMRLYKAQRIHHAYRVNQQRQKK
ncbi:MAG: hypothetical protein NC409_12620 [Clostridium sp.]|nr:hypothetical protein [Clostridium sp.]